MAEAILELTPELFVELAKASKGGQPRRFMVKSNPLPDDAEIVRVYYMPNGNLGLWLSSAEFPDSDQVPTLPPVMFETIFDPPASGECEE